MAIKKIGTSGSGVLSSYPMQLTRSELFTGLSGGNNTGVGSTKPGRSGSSSGRGGGSGDYVGSSAPAVDQTERLQNLFTELSETTFAPVTVTYTPESEADIGKQIAEWLLPSYEQAITERQERTRTYAAEMDADAIARGMGASTFVTDVKSRQQRDEARDIATLRSEYGAVLAQNVSERLSEEKDRQLDADMFNAEARQNAYELAYQAAVLLMGLGAVAHEKTEEETDEQ